VHGARVRVRVGLSSPCLARLPRAAWPPGWHGPSVGFVLGAELAAQGWLLVAADRFPFEEIAVPTLVINARDDTTFAPYRFAAKAAARIPGATLVSTASVPRGQPHDSGG